MLFYKLYILEVSNSIYVFEIFTLQIYVETKHFTIFQFYQFEILNFILKFLKNWFFII